MHLFQLIHCPVELCSTLLQLPDIIISFNQFSAQNSSYLLIMPFPLFIIYILFYVSLEKLPMCQISLSSIISKF